MLFFWSNTNRYCIIWACLNGLNFPLHASLSHCKAWRQIEQHDLMKCSQQDNKEICIAAVKQLGAITCCMLWILNTTVWRWEYEVYGIWYQNCMLCIKLDRIAQDSTLCKLWIYKLLTVYLIGKPSQKWCSIQISPIVTAATVSIKTFTIKWWYDTISQGSK